MVRKQRRINIGNAISVVLIVIISFFGCKTSKSKKALPPRTDNFSDMVGYVFTDNYAYVLDLQKNSLSAKIRLPAKPEDIFFSGGDIFFSSDFLFKLSGGKVNKIIRLPRDYCQAYKSGEEIYLLKRTGVNSISSDYNLSLSEEPIKLNVEFERVWVLDRNGLSIYSATEPVPDNKEIHRIPVDGAIDFLLAPYGIRVYIAKQGFIDVFDTQKFNFITHISVKGMPRFLKFAPATDKIYCVTETDPSSQEAMLYIINRGLNKTEQILRMDNIKDLVLSRDGSYGVIVSDSTIHFLNCLDNKIIDKNNLKVIDVTTSLGDSRIYCLTAGELVTIEADSFKATSRIKLGGGRKVLVVPFAVAEAESVTSRFFVIQISLGKQDSVSKYVELLKKNYYPARGFEFTESNKVRVGFFRSREDATLFRSKIDSIIAPNPVEIVEAPIDSTIILDASGRDINGDGFANDAVQAEGKNIIIFEFRGGVYTEIYRCSKDDLTYVGQPEIKFVGDKLTVVTPLINGAYSIIEHCARDTSASESNFIERISK